MALFPAAFPYLAALTALLVGVTLLPLSRSTKWWVRGWDFPRLQLAGFALLLLGAQLTLLEYVWWQTWLVPGITAACLIYQAWWIVPYTPFYPAQVKLARESNPDRTLRIINANVLTPNRNAAKLLAIVRERNPDILVTLESDSWWESQLDALQEAYAHTIRCPLDNLYGMHVYSRLPLSDPRIEFLVERDVPSMHACVHLPSGDRVRAHFLHPAPPSPTENPESAERDAELIVVAQAVEGADLPVVVTGDLNDVAWSKTTRLFRKISGLLDPRIGRGTFNTFHSDYWFARWPLDHIFHSHHFQLVKLERLGHFGSDHFPLYSELVLRPHADQEPESAEAEDRSLAQELAERKDVTSEDVPEPR
ncbi:MAG: endonuclease/exonuclease/phosphatase family protein [Rhodothermales bacterium]|nr:endonuclease/exonuclease/phosphatase family protein [Rhodothermales bacterium]MBO6781179.1 endonuclease/exonuclease/phosphatase family protein [Rhodothermales bacterium]